MWLIMYYGAKNERFSQIGGNGDPEVTVAGDPFPSLV
jgi:hypothetical protein